MAMKTSASDTKFTVFIRLPFERGDFIDPPPVEWNAVKDQALWDILSRPSKGDDIDWKALAENFDVDLQFLLQQAAWLYDRKLSMVRAQMRKVPPVKPSEKSNIVASVPVVESATASSPPQKGQITLGFRAPSRQGPPQQDASQQVPSGRRTSSTSTTTVNQFRHNWDTSRTDTPTEGREQSWEQYVRPPSVMTRDPYATPSFGRSPPIEEDDYSSSSEESDSSEEAPRTGLRFRKFGQFSTQRVGFRDDDDDDDDDAPAFAPLTRDSDQASRDRSGEELSATLRMGADRAARKRLLDRTGSRQPPATESSTSSLSSGVRVESTHSDAPRPAGQPSTLSPHRAGEAPRRSPRHPSAPGREPSDGTPSMGSSFSDLDDASVTQSALEEALASNMQHGGMASRMSTISHAFRSRYLP
ncbi:hypothetical protein N7462_001733 [Penicillium macrosclerotiorum]|uniref:uncharacterized protein n=1 Tax=Penicillium macrosclerotiorum TaxID=303699 RepID=UPI0025466E2E|nr:uncharacterized protein N7462_001733 [Penicillium macrosclerotiorum]KAJ5692310.1 hypothetical protein N7462_001733 [Penicillium macrosclerotiorum]